MSRGSCHWPTPQPCPRAPLGIAPRTGVPHLLSTSTKAASTLRRPVTKLIDLLFKSLFLICPLWVRL